MKTVFSSHSQVAHVWAQQNQPHGRGKNMFFEGSAIYSWGKHWTIAFFVDPACTKFIQLIGGNVIINTESRSVSTHKHTGEVEGALRGLSHRAVRIEDGSCVERLHRVSSLGQHWIEMDKDDALIAEYAQYCQEEYKRWSDRYQRVSEKYQHNHKRAPLKFSEAAYNMLRFAGEYNRVVMSTEDGVMRLPSGRELSPLSGPEMTRIRNINDTITAYISERDAKKEATKREQERIREEKRLAKLEQLKPYMDEAIITWRKGEERQTSDIVREAINAFVYNSPTTRLRCRNGTDIQTSRGADVPLSHAKMLVRYVQRVVRQCTDAHPHGHVFTDVDAKVGHFSLRYIDTRNNYVQVGCHRLTFDEINQFVDYASEHLDIGVDTSYKLP